MADTDDLFARAERAGEKYDNPRQYTRWRADTLRREARNLRKQGDAMRRAAERGDEEAALLDEIAHTLETQHAQIGPPTT